MTGFRCIGADCEDHCCSGWKISLDEEDYRRLQAHRKHSQLLNEVFNQGVVREQKLGAGLPFAHLEYRAASGSCFFEDAGLCGIHRDCGESALPKTCATFPRVIHQDRNQQELSGSFSCPEVARLCLLSSDPFDLVDLPTDFLPPHFEFRSRSGELEQKLLEPLLPHLRASILALLDLPDLCLESRIYLFLYLICKLELFFSRDFHKDPGPRLMSLLARFKDPVFLARTLKNLERAQPNPLNTRFLFLVLNARRTHPHHDRYNLMVLRLFKGYGMDGNNLDSSSFDDIREQFLAQKKVIVARFGIHLNRYFSRYTRNIWFQQDLQKVSCLADIARKFVLSFATIKFLFFGNPDIVALAHCQSTGPGVSRLDQLAVEIIQTFAKNISHNADLLHSLSDNMLEKGLGKLDALASLLKM